MKQPLLKEEKDHSVERPVGTPGVSGGIYSFPETARLLEDLRSIIGTARVKVAQAVNSGIVLLYWHIGRRIHQDILGNQRAEYGEQIVQTVSEQLTQEYGRGYGRTNLFNMVRFAEVFPDLQIVQTLSGQLGWSHFLEIIHLNDANKRDFYAEFCRLERWSVRTMRAKISGMLYERVGLSKKPAELAREELKAIRERNEASNDVVFHDPYLLDFLNLSESHSEKDLESAILRELERFLIELGSDFAFIARQKRITVDNEDYYIDLLFFHRRMRALVCVELKLGKFKAADKGQMELYLRWLEKHDMRPGENPPVGLILCSAKGHEAVELMQLEKSGIRVAQYLTQLPPRQVFEKKLHQAIDQARQRLDCVAH